MREADTLGAVLDDVARVFSYDRDSRPQDRAHAYLSERRVPRGYDDTALQCAAADMVMRAQAVARSERAREADGLAAAAAEASGVAARMARLAAEVGRGSA